MATLPNRKTDIKPADQLQATTPQTAAQQTPAQAPLVGALPDATDLLNAITPENRHPETPVAPLTAGAGVPAPLVPQPVVTFHVAQSRKTLMANALSRIALKAPQADGDSITLFWNPRPAANASPADPQSISIGAQNAPRMVYTGYGCTIPAGYRGIVVSLPEHGPVRPLMYLLAGKHDIDLAVPHSYAGSNVHGVQIGPCAAVGRLILERSVVVQCEIDEG